MLRKSKAKQTVEDRRRRWQRGGVCPVHGLSGQPDGWFYPCNSAAYVIEVCGMPGCGITWQAFGFEGPWELLPEFTHLIGAEPTAVAGCRRCGAPEVLLHPLTVHGYCEVCIHAIIAEHEHRQTRELGVQP